ncbi:hypothetical protein F0169_23895 [Pseudomonas sp. MAFF 212408]|uniref:Uncharacterized protein n=1 Tax=Pseudomonas kitaguniensis TaxID=2607908 RepID=A0A5N7KRQ4_9PSED|nr:hypothetical protein [Pseudomonas kitaguniensis]
MWERACSRMRCVSRYIWRLIQRIREQARSHTSPLPHKLTPTHTSSLRSGLGGVPQGLVRVSCIRANCRSSIDG